MQIQTLQIGLTIQIAFPERAAKRNASWNSLQLRKCLSSGFVSEVWRRGLVWHGAGQPGSLPAFLDLVFSLTVWVLVSCCLNKVSWNDLPSPRVTLLHASYGRVISQHGCLGLGCRGPFSSFHHLHGMCHLQGKGKLTFPKCLCPCCLT